MGRMKLLMTVIVSAMALAFGIYALQSGSAFIGIGMFGLVFWVIIKALR